MLAPECSSEVREREGGVTHPARVCRSIVCEECSGTCICINNVEETRGMKARLRYGDEEDEFLFVCRRVLATMSYCYCVR